MKRKLLFMNDAEMNALPGAFVVIWIFGAIIAIIQVIGVWKMYKKAGIPLLNIYDWLRMSGFSTGWSLVGSIGTLVGTILVGAMSIQNHNDLTAASVVFVVIIGVLTAILQIMSCFKIAKRFGRGVGIGFLFLLFAPIMCMIAGFGKTWIYQKHY